MAKPRTGGEIVVNALEQAGVTTCFGVPGESFLGILDALYDSSIRFISARHEGGASFMASGYSRAARQIGVCCGTRAVGTANLTVGLHNARQDSTPMIAFAGQVNRSFAGREAFQEVDLVRAMAPFAKWATDIPSAAMAPEIMARAINAATSGRPGPVFLSIPQDVCDELTDEPSIAPPRISAPAPEPEAITMIVDAILRARRPLLFTGGGVTASEGASQLLIEFAEAAEVPVITSWRRHDGFPNDHRLFLGSASLGAARSVWDRLRDADMVVVLGNRMQENATAGYELPSREARLYQIDIDPSVLVSHRSPELAVQADASKALRALLDALPSPPPGLAERHVQNDVDRARFVDDTTLPERTNARQMVSFPAVLHGLKDALPENAVVSSDAGNFYAWISRYHRFVQPNTYLGPASGAMGYGLPAAIGAKLARPGAPVVSLSGDGGFLMTMSELETAVRYGVDVIAIVLDNSRHGTIRMHQEREHPGRVIGTDLGVTDLAAVARGLGATGFLVDDDDGFEPALREALVTAGPSVIHLRMDPDQLSVDRRLESNNTEQHHVTP